MTAPAPEKLLEKYKLLQEFSISEERTIQDRSRDYLTTTAILLAAFGLARDIVFLRYAIPAVGVIFNFFWYYSGKRNALAFHYWRREMHIIEEEFEAFGKGYEVFNLISNRERYYAGEPVDTVRTEHLETSGTSVHRDRIHQYIPVEKDVRPKVRLYHGAGIQKQFPWKFLGSYLNLQMIYTPAFFLLAWMAILILLIPFPNLFGSTAVAN